MLIIRLALAGVFTVVVISFITFGFASPGKPQDIRDIETAIVFSGADERIRAGLELLKAGVVKRLYISGANANSGIWLKEFEQQFGNRNGNLKPLLECCIRFGALANSTLQNALETRCWLEQQGLRGPIVLVTSARHMPRARAALKHILPLMWITPYPVANAPANTSEWLRQQTIEYIKYLATIALSELPSALVPQALYGAFYSRCSLSHSDPSTPLNEPLTFFRQ